VFTLSVSSVFLLFNRTPLSMSAPVPHSAVTFRPELVHSSAFIARGAVVLGDVTIGEQSSVWFQAVIRGDCEAIRIGRRTNVQDGSILHADPGFPCMLGDDVTVGHGAIVHGATVGNRVLIGMRAVVMNGVEIGDESVIGVGAVVTEGTKIPAGSVVLGLPGKIVRQVTPDDIARIRHAAEHYVAAARQYLATTEQPN
jgi:carbonic anhydrase/acetyltransferase-like protein (isoleucine patch superfamily)